MEDNQRLDKVESRMDKIEERQTRIETEHAETKVYVKQIFERIDGLKEDMFNYFNQAAQSEDDNTTRWMEFVKWIIAGTIFLIVAYVFR